ncbi:MAG: hypothetical protein IT553_07175 [Sphingomonadaceae bacterium]|nr:hypothetical protein [Sphingomonadaceae bacterium]
MTTKEKPQETPTPPAAGLFGATVPPKFKREISPLATKSANDAARAKR